MSTKTKATVWYIFGLIFYMLIWQEKDIFKVASSLDSFLRPNFLKEVFYQKISWMIKEFEPWNSWSKLNFRLAGPKTCSFAFYLQHACNLNVSWVMEFLTGGYKIRFFFIKKMNGLQGYCFVLWIDITPVSYLKLVNFEFSKSTFCFKNCLYYI